MHPLSRRHPAALAVSIAMLVCMLVSTGVPGQAQAARDSGAAASSLDASLADLNARTSKPTSALPSNYDIRVMGGARLTALINASVSGGVQGLAADARTKLADRRLGLSQLAARVPGATASFSPLTGVPEVVSSARGPLSAASSRSGFAIAQDFLRANQALYGLSSAQINTLHFIGESVSSANGLRMVRLEQRLNGASIFGSETRVILDRTGRIWRTLGLLVPDGAAVAGGKSIAAADAWRAAMSSVGLNVAASAVQQNGAAALHVNDRRVSGPVSNTQVYFALAPGVLVPAWAQLTSTPDADWYTLTDARTATPLWRKNTRDTDQITVPDQGNAHTAVGAASASFSPAAAWQHMLASSGQTGSAPMASVQGSSPAASNQDARFRVYVQADGKTPADSPAPKSPTIATPGSDYQAPAIAPSIVKMSVAQNTTASPNGWIADGGTTTTGNNVDAYLDTDADDLPDTGALDSNGRPTGNPDGAARNRDFLGTAPRDFQSGFLPPPQGGNPEAGQTASGNTSFQRGSVTQLFYDTNWYHDQLYSLGFDEAAGNFQTDNFGKGGNGNDAVHAEAQDGSGTSNANFNTPPDGTPGRMQMYVFDGPTIDRDGDLDAEIVLHELTHGLSNRLIGNGSGLQWSVGGGMGEGWSDFYALSLLNNTNADDPDGIYASGGYATYKLLTGYTDNYVYGIRRFPYSTDNSVSPLTWADVDDVTFNPSGGIPISPIGFEFNGGLEVHNIGEIWMLSLWEVRSRIIADPKGAKGDVPTGNRTMLQLVTDALKLTPNNPSFTDARDALLAADCATNKCANEQSIWAGFADRGLGYGAVAPLGIVGAFDLGHMSVGTSTAVPYLANSATSINDAAGNGNGAIDPGEAINLSVTLKNPWQATAQNVASATATLTSATPGVSIVNATSTYGPIAAQGTATNLTPFVFSLSSTTSCGQSLEFTLTTTSSLGTTSTPVTLRVGKSNGTDAPITYKQTIAGGLAIPDGQARGVTNALSITDDKEIADLNYRIDSLTHTYTGDLTALLRGPNGYGSDLIWLRGILGNTGNADGDNFINTLIDDQATNDLNQTSPTDTPYTGSWLPAFNSPVWNLLGDTTIFPDPVGQLSRYNGMSTKGSWTTLIADNFQQDSGTLNAWSLIVTPVHFDCAAFTPVAKLVGTKTVTGPFNVGSPITYTVVLSNTGTGAQGNNAGHELNDVLPPQLTLVDASATNGTTVATISTNTVTWDGTLAPITGTATITIHARIKSGTVGATVANQGAIKYDGDGNGTNEASATTDDPSTAAANDATKFTVANRAPVASADSYTTASNTQLTVSSPGVLSNDSDADAGDTLKATIQVAPKHAASFTLNANGSFVYRPVATFKGTDTFTYRAVDNHGTLSAIATVTITVSAPSSINIYLPLIQR